MPSSSKMYTVVAMLSILKLLFEYSILHKKSGKVCKASRVSHLVLSQLLKMLNKGFISLVIAILLTFETFCNGYYYDEEERDNILEQRIRNLEEPGNTIFTLILTFFSQYHWNSKLINFFHYFPIKVWTVPHGADRWNKCNEVGICHCNEIKKFLYCNVNGSLHRDMQIPWDTEIL